MSDNDLDDDSLKQYVEDPTDKVKPIDFPESGPENQKPDGSPLSQEPDLDDFSGIKKEDAGNVNIEKNLIHKGDYVDLLEKEPTLARIVIGAGWDQKAVEEQMIDADLSVFLLNTKDETRIDEDFIFYNNAEACDGAIKHRGDNRTGAGEGDDENIYIDLNGLPYDIAKIMFVLSVYDQQNNAHNFDMIKNVFIRLLNSDDNKELIRYQIAEDDLGSDKAMYVASIIREGPKWHFEALGKPAEGSLAKVASEYGIIIKELQSTGT